MHPCAALALLPLVAAPPAPPAPPRTPSILWKIPLKSPSFGGAAIADADTDGSPDIAFGTYFGDGSVHVLRGKDGSELWRHTPETDACVDASMKFDDIDDDGKLDLVAPISNLSRVLAFDAATGQIKWTCQLTAPECIDTPPLIQHVPLASFLVGFSLIAVGTFGGTIRLIDASDGVAFESFKAAPGAIQSCPVAADLNSDGLDDFVVGNFNGDHKLHAIDGDKGTELWSVQTGSHIYHGPAVGDLDGDGHPDFVFGSYDGKVYAVNHEGRELWTVKTGDRYIMAPLTLADLDADSKPEAISTSQKITAIHQDGTVFWSVDADDTKGMDSTTRGVAVADLDADGSPDLAYLTGAGLFRVLRGRDGALIYELDAAKATGTACSQCSHAPAIADLNGDGKLDVFFVIGTPAKESRVGMAVALTGFDGTGPGWTMFRHDLENTGNAATKVGP